MQAAAAAGAFGPGVVTPELGYSVVYHVELLLLFATLIVIAPLVRFENIGRGDASARGDAETFGLTEFPT